MAQLKVLKQFEVYRNGMILSSPLPFDPQQLTSSCFLLRACASVSSSERPSCVGTSLEFHSNKPFCIQDGADQGPRFPGTLPGPEVPVESHLPGPLACGEKCFKIGPAALCTSHTTELLSLLAVALVGSPAARGVSKSGLRRFVTSRTTGLVLTVPSHYD